MDKRYQVFVSSTYADLREERQKVFQTLMEMDCIPAGMELFPAADEEQWEFIKKVIDDCDYYLLIIGERYGSLTPEGISYTEKEYDYAVSKGLKVLSFVHEDPDDLPVKNSDIDPDLRTKLDAFRGRVSESRLVKFWRNATDLPGLVALSLTKTIKTHPAIGWIRASNAPKEQLLVDLNEVRKENSQLRDKLAEFESRDAAANLDLASLDDQYEVVLQWEVSDGNFHRIPHSANVSTSWADIFGLISPDLVHNPSDHVVNQDLAWLLFRRGNPGERRDVLVEHECFQAIRVQVCALGLVDLSNSEYHNGTKYLSWGLTKKGQNLMMQLRTMKAASDATDEKNEGES